MRSRINDVIHLGPWLVHLSSGKNVLSIDIKSIENELRIMSDNDIGAYPGEIGTRLHAKVYKTETLRKCSPLLSKTADNICIDNWVIWMSVTQDGYLSYLVKHRSGRELSESIGGKRNGEYRARISLSGESASILE